MSDGGSDTGAPRGADPRPKPRCVLLNEDGNVFNVVGCVRRALRNAGQADRAREFVERAFAAKSYDEVLAMLDEYVDIR